MNQDVCVSYYKSGFVGWLELKVSPLGVVGLTFAGVPPSESRSQASPLMDQLISELDLYFSGALKRFSVPLDIQAGTAFERRVWDVLIPIPWGQTWSYSRVAAAIGQPRACRAVGSANGRNRIPILIPCHRVIRSDGSLGGYSSGLHIKKKLLELESIQV